MTRDELYNFWRFEETFPFSGWDFAHLDGRWEQEPLPWDFYAEVQRRLHYADQLLEVDTGGAFLLSLRHPYENTAVTELMLTSGAECGKLPQRACTARHPCGGMRRRRGTAAVCRQCV